MDNIYKFRSNFHYIFSFNIRQLSGFSFCSKDYKIKTEKYINQLSIIVLESTYSSHFSLQIFSLFECLLFC